MTSTPLARGVGASRAGAVAACLALASLGARAANDYVPVTIQGGAAASAAPSTATFGVPLAEGRLRGSWQLRLVRTTDGSALPAQFETMATWPDGTIRWLLVDAQRPAGDATTSLAVTQDPYTPAPAPAAPVTVTDLGAAFAVNTGAAAFTVPKSRFHLLDTAVVGGANALAAGGMDLVATSGGTVYRASQDAGSTVTVEESGPVRAVLLATGTLRDSSGNALLPFRVRLHFFAGSAGVRAQVTITNDAAAVHPNNVWDLGSSGSSYFDDVSVTAPLPPAGAPLTWTEWSYPAAPRTGILGTSVVLYQESSGGNRWNWNTHVDRFNVVPLTFRGWQLRVDGTTQASGDRAFGGMDLSSAASGVTAGIWSFWQEFPKALRAVAPGTLSVGLFPDEFPEAHELQGGEAKTQEIVLLFHAGPAASGTLPALQDLLDPPRGRPGRDECIRSQALGRFGPKDPTPAEPYETTVSYIAFDQGNRSFFTQREQIDEYGWRNFGEAFADHETDCGTQCWDCPISHDNDQYDYDWASLLFWIRNGEPEWFQLGDEGIRHLEDIDVYHTGADTPVYDHGLFWHTTHDTNAYTCTHRTYSALMSSACTPYLSGGPALGHLYTDGLLLHAYLTGERRDLDVHAELEQYLRTRYALDAPTPGSGYEVRAWANALRTAVAAYRRTWDATWLTFIRQLLSDSSPATNPTMDGTTFGDSMLMVSLGRFLDLERERGDLGSADAATAFTSLETLASRVRANYPPHQDVLDFRYSEGLWAAYEYAPASDPDKASWQSLARAFFTAGEQTGFFNTYITCKGEAHVATNGHLDAYFERGRIPADVQGLRVTRSGVDVILSWQPVAADVDGVSVAIAGYGVHRSVDRPTRFSDVPFAQPVPATWTAMGDAASGTPALICYDVRALASPGIEGY